MNVIFDYFTKDNITFVIALIGAIGSLSSWIYNIKTRSKRLRLSILSHEYRNQTHVFCLSIENLSQLPITISDIYLLINGERYSCVRIPQKVIESVFRSNNEIVTRESIYTLALPYPLESLGGVQGYFSFPKCPQTLATSQTLVTFEVHTNRGKLIEMKLPLSD